MTPHFKIYPVASDFVSFASFKLLLLLCCCFSFMLLFNLYYRCKYVSSSFEATPEAPFVVHSVLTFA